MLEVKELQTQTNAIVEGIMGLEIDTSATIGQEEQKDVIDWYKKRFDMFKEDDMLIAINPYLTRLAHDPNVNEYTKLLVMHYATGLLSSEN